MPERSDFKTYNWLKPNTLEPEKFICGYCGENIASEKGYKVHHKNNANTQRGGIFLCPLCSCPTFLSPNLSQQIPGPVFGKNVKHVPKDLETLFLEARDSIANSNYTAAVLISRKILMNIAVAQGAKEGQRFIEYVNYISEEGFVPPNGKHWVDHIRKKGNEANHEIILMNQQDATELLTFIEMLLRFIYEFPNLIPKQEK